MTVPATADVTAEWTGIDLRLLHRWLPGNVGLDGGALRGGLPGKSSLGSGLTLRAATPYPGEYPLEEDREALDIDDLTAELEWSWQGALPLSFADISAGRLVMKGRAGASGVLTLEGRPIRVEEGSFNLEGNERGMRSNR